VTRRVRLTERAEDDLRRLETFLVDKNPDAALRAVDAIAQAILSLGEYADRGFPGPIAKLKQIPVPFGDSGYVIQYRVQGDSVIVARVKHARERR